MQRGRNVFHLIPLFHLIPQICFQRQERSIWGQLASGGGDPRRGVSPSLIPLQPRTRANRTEDSPSRSSQEHPSTLWSSCRCFQCWQSISGIFMILKNPKTTIVSLARQKMSNLSVPIIRESLLLGPIQVSSWCHEHPSPLWDLKYVKSYKCKYPGWKHVPLSQGTAKKVKSKKSEKQKKWKAKRLGCAEGIKKLLGRTLLK